MDQEEWRRGLDFSEEELIDMATELNLVGSERPGHPEATVRVPVPTELDLLVEEAFGADARRGWDPADGVPSPDSVGIGPERADDLEPEVTIDVRSPLMASVEGPGASLDDAVHQILIAPLPSHVQTPPPPPPAAFRSAPPAAQPAEMVATAEQARVSSQSVIGGVLPEPLPATAPLPVDVVSSQEDLTTDEIELLREPGSTVPPLPVQASSLAGAAAQTPSIAPPNEFAPTITPVSRGRRQKRIRAWFEEIFDEDYLRTLPFMTARQTEREVDFIEASLAVPKSARLLDVGAGYGRHALELAVRGYQIVGIDLSLPLLIRAADEAQRRGLDVSFVHGDMRELRFEGDFDGAYCMFTTFGYFDDETNRKVAQSIARSLRPKGRLLVEVVNRDYVISTLPARVWWEGDGCVVLEEVEFNVYNSRMLSHRSVVFEDGRQVEQEISVRAYSLHELGKVLHQAGLRVIEVSGSLATRGEFFGADSRVLFCLAEKR